MSNMNYSSWCRPHKLLKFFFRFQVVQLVLVFNNNLRITGYDRLKPSTNGNNILHSFTQR